MCGDRSSFQVCKGLKGIFFNMQGKSWRDNAGPGERNRTGRTFVSGGGVGRPLRNPEDARKGCMWKGLQRVRQREEAGSCSEANALL